MSLYHADSFDVYGTTSALMLQGIYLDATSITITTANPRTGLRAARAGSTGSFLRYGVTSSKTFGIGYAIALTSLPSDSTSLGLASFRDASNNNQVSLWVTPLGEIEVRAGDHTGTIIGRTGPATIFPSSYKYIEVWVRCDDDDGFIRIGVGDSSSLSFQVLNLENVDTDTTGLLEVSSIGIFNRRAAGSPTFDVDDLAIYDTTGSYNNEAFVGDSRVIAMLPDADTANADWVKSTGADGFALVNGSPPDDTKYITTASPNATSRFALVNIVTPNLYRVRGVVVYSRQEVATAGTTSTVVSMKNGTSISDGTPKTPTTSFAYYKDLFETDPATSGAWTVISLNTASIQVKKLS